MEKKKKKTAISTVFTIIVVAAVMWMKYKETKDGKQREGSVRDASVEITEPGDKKGFAESQRTAVSLSSSRFEVLEGCKLIDHRGNDGDSFHISTPKGREEVRLYYVDAPESAARTYGNGDTNHKRISQQGAAMGGLNQQQTTQVGVVAKKFVKKVLEGKTFRIATTREKVYNSHRIYAYVVVEWEGHERYLHELLVAFGLGRIHTQPMTLPDNTSSSRHKEHLRGVEKHAKAQKLGAWSIQ